ncbi:hypothetical protein Taro_001583 [Colocasia esculenta]|uniref:Uncharacterized protein n=1 Tax=Colocasia esculenta TaxID=4460 RepID=A0A843TL57_COLES|nr:hypothetical protein [Colocasia esculenta]
MDMCHVGHRMETCRVGHQKEMCHVGHGGETCQAWNNGKMCHEGHRRESKEYKKGSDAQYKRMDCTINENKMPPVGRECGEPRGRYFLINFAQWADGLALLGEFERLSMIGGLLTSVGVSTSSGMIGIDLEGLLMAMIGGEDSHSVNLFKCLHPFCWMGVDMVGVMGGCMASGDAMGMKGKICSGLVANGVGEMGGVMIGVMVGGGLIMEGLVNVDGNPEPQAVEEVGIVVVVVVEVRESAWELEQVQRRAHELLLEWGHRRAQLEVVESGGDESVDALVAACCEEHFGVEWVAAGQMREYMGGYVAKSPEYTKAGAWEKEKEGESHP